MQHEEMLQVFISYTLYTWNSYTHVHGTQGNKICMEINM